MQLEEVLLEMLPGYEPPVEEDDSDPALAQLHAPPGLPPPGNLPPGRYYMDVPPMGGTPGGAPGMPPAPQTQWNPAWANVSPAWRSQFRMPLNGPPGPPPPPPPGVTLPSKSRKPTPVARR